MTDKIDGRLQILEEKFEYQERMIDSLNDVIIEQQAQLTLLEEKVIHLQSLLESLQDPTTEGEEPPPPHY